MMTRLERIEFIEKFVRPSPAKDQTLAKFRSMSDEEFTNYMLDLDERHAKIVRTS